MKAELEYNEPCCSVCGKEYDLVCEDCRRVLRVVDRKTDLTFHCYKSEGFRIHVCNECNEKREKEPELCDVSGCEGLGYHRTAWNEVLCRECHYKKWKETIKKEEGVKK